MKVSGMYERDPRAGLMLTDAGILEMAPNSLASAVSGSILDHPELTQVWAELHSPLRPQPSTYFASGASAPFNVTSPLTVLGSTVISFSFVSTSAGTSF